MHGNRQGDVRVASRLVSESIVSLGNLSSGGGLRGWCAGRDPEWGGGDGKMYLASSVKDAPDCVRRICNHRSRRRANIQLAARTTAVSSMHFILREISTENLLYGTLFTTV